jgi:hypothetical protein
VSVQNWESYPPARGKKQTSFEKQSDSACSMGVKYNKMIYFSLFSAKEILNKV